MPCPHRQLFMRAKRDDCGWQVYVASALMEWASRDEALTRKIFEFGLQRHSGCADYVLQYIAFLKGERA